MRKKGLLPAFLLCSTLGVASPALTQTTSSATSDDAPGARPNVIIILADDVGFSDIGAFGGEIETPALDRLAENGTRFTQFYNTARCCPTRASLLTGLYPHQAGVGHLIFKTGHPGYGDHLAGDTVTLPEALQKAGYSTYMAGKWHLAPRTYDPEKDVNHWPTSRGFDRFYGTINGSGSFFDPSTLCRDTTYISPENDPEYQPEEFYYTDALTDNAIQFLTDHEAGSDDKPFFLYLSYTAAHWPLHAPEDAIEPYRGKYDQGYEPVHAARAKRLRKLDLVPEVGQIAPPVGDWSRVKNKKVEVSLMETYAAMLTRMDEGIGRVVEHLRASGQLDNTLIIYLQDNGACAEDPFASPGATETAEPMAPEQIQVRARPRHTRDGKPVRMGHDVEAGPADTFTAYKENWANVSNSPFRWYKHYVHEGGISTPLIAHWPAGIASQPPSRIVRQPAHLIDLMPTILELAQTTQPERRHGVKVQPLEGVSLVPLLNGTGTIRREKPIFFEHEGNRAVRDGKWKIVALSETGPWELYDISVDRGEVNDLASRHPEIVRELAAKWDAWAARARVLPLGGWRDRASRKEDQPGTATSVVLTQGDSLPRNKSLNLDRKGLNITAEITAGPVEGVIVAQGASHNGYSLYAQDGVISFVTRHNRKMSQLKQGKIPAPPFTVNASLSPNGKALLSFDNERFARGAFPGPLVATPTQGIAAGLDTETPVGDYPAEFPFQGKLGKVIVHTLAK